MRAYVKYVSAVTVFATLLVLYTSWSAKSKPISFANRVPVPADSSENDGAVSVWVSVTKVDRGHLLSKFRKFFKSLVGRRGVRCVLRLHVITDNASRPTVDGVVREYGERRDTIPLQLVYYDFRDVLKTVDGKIRPLKRFFRSPEGSYYSDDVFYLSPALHLVAPDSLDKAIVVDVDTEFRSSACDLHDAFDNFTHAQLFGLAPEQSPVYHHILWKWRNYKRNWYNARNRTDLNGLNSGVILLYLERIRKSSEYDRLFSPEWISNVVQKYLFKGHLGDQDWYTLVSYERPDLIYRLSCGWNRQLCTWWKQHGYADTFDSFAKCTDKIHLYHGNCDTPISP